MMATEKRPTKKQQAEADKAEAIERLRKILKPGDTVRTVLRHVSSSGMSRVIDLYAVSGGDLIWLSGMASTACGFKMDPKRQGIRIGGCGMDMGFAIVYELSSVLFRDRFECIGDRCPSNDHSNGDRDRTPHKHSDGGYALRHSWL
jgi:hypothetical protein